MTAATCSAHPDGTCAPCGLCRDARRRASAWADRHVNPAEIEAEARRRVENRRRHRMIEERVAELLSPSHEQLDDSADRHAPTMLPWIEVRSGRVRITETSWDDALTSLRTTAYRIDPARAVAALRVIAAEIESELAVFGKSPDRQAERGDGEGEVQHRVIPIPLTDAVRIAEDAGREVGLFRRVLGMLFSRAGQQVSSAHDSPSVGAGSHPASPIVGAASGVDSSATPDAPERVQS